MCEATGAQSMSMLIRGDVVLVRRMLTSFDLNGEKKTGGGNGTKLHKMVVLFILNS